MAGKRRSVDENRVIAHHAIVADVRVGHDQVVAADASDAAALLRAAANRAKFAEIIAIADFERYPLAGKRQILRIATNSGERIKMIRPAKSRRALHHGMMIDDAAIAKLDLVAHHGVRPNFRAVSNSGRR